MKSPGQLNPRITERISCINSIQSLTDENGIQFTKSKTVTKNSTHAEPDLELYDDLPTPVGTATKFLGLVFDSKLTFAAHIKYLKDRCLKATNLLRVVANKNWGAESVTLRSCIGRTSGQSLTYATLALNTV